MRGVDLVRLMRPWQWYKNLVVFIPLIFSNNAGQWDLYPVVILAFLAFCLLSGGAYAFNDALDADADRRHPKKKARPIASGTVPRWLGMAWGATLVAGGLIVLAATNPPTLMFGALFLVLQLAYTLVLKAYPLVDIISIGVGFVLRALAGTTAIDVGAPTTWLILCTFLFAVFLALAKRHHELLLSAANGGDASETRASLAGYHLGFTEQMTVLVAALLLMSYFLYTFFGTTPWMMTTIPFAVFGVFRYLLLVHERDLRTETEMMFTDRALLVAAAAWILTVVLVLRGLPQTVFAWLEALAP